MRILVTGGRTRWDRDTIMKALEHYSGGRSDVTVVHGNCRGADLIAAECAEELMFHVEAHPADWSLGKGAGHIRNQAMVDSGADICLAFPSATSVGTWDCVRRARAAGIRTVICV